MKTFESFMFEKKTYGYEEWGWISPKGQFFDGNSDPDCIIHNCLIKKYDTDLTTTVALRRGWVRWYVEKISMQKDNTPSNLRLVIETYKNGLGNVRTWIKNTIKTYGAYHLYLNEGNDEKVITADNEEDLIKQLKKY